MTFKMVCVCDYCKAQEDVSIKEDIPFGWIRLKRDGMNARGCFDVCRKCVEGDPLLKALYLMSEEPRIKDPRPEGCFTTTNGEGDE